MCVVSAIHEYGQKVWELPNGPWTPTPIQINNLPTKEELAEFRRLLEAARIFDEKTNQPNCVDPDKEAWLNKLETLVESLHDHLKAKPGTED